MRELQDELAVAFEEDGYEVGDVTTNRKQVRIGILDDSAESDKLREIVHRVVGEENVLGLDVTTESVEGQDEVRTVVSFRSRS
jgi:hypothetical protein